MCRLPEAFKGIPKWAALMFLLALVSLSGCSYLAGGGEVTLSTDGSLAAYISARQWDLPLPPECPTIRSTVRLRWCNLTRPEDYHEIEIGVFGRDWGGWNVKNRVHPVFSPDNRHLAVACPRRLRVVDCATRKERTLTGPREVVTSLMWLDKDVLAYASCCPDLKGQREKTPLNFWRQGVDQSYEERSLIFSQDQPSGCPGKGLGAIEWPMERWSPDGRFVLFSSEGYQGDLKLLDVASGTARVIASGGYTFQGISWKSDGSAAACVGFSRKAPVAAFVIDPRTGEKDDFSEDYQAFARDSGSSQPVLAGLWAPGDQYLVVNHLRMGGCLVSPRPWKLIPVAKLVIGELLKDRSLALAEDPNERLPWVFWQPVQGWVKVWVQFQEQGYRRGMDYVVDYSGRSRVLLGKSDAPGAGWKLTPDGERAVKLEPPDKVIVRGLTLPLPDSQE